MTKISAFAENPILVCSSRRCGIFQNWRTVKVSLLATPSVILSSRETSVCQASSFRVHPISEVHVHCTRHLLGMRLLAHCSRPSRSISDHFSCQAYATRYLHRLRFPVSKLD